MTIVSSQTRLNRDMLDDIPRHLHLPSVVKPGRPQLGMPGQVLSILQRHSLRQEVSDRRHPETVRR